MLDESLGALVESQWFIPLFIFLWLGGCALLAHVSGWASLIKRYAATGRVDGTRFRFASGALGRKYFSVSYGNCLFVTINSQGMRLSIFFPFRFLCPPLFLPWSSLETVEKRHFLFFPYHVLTIRDHWARLSLYASAGQRGR
jgi:hypothetical protein